MLRTLEIRALRPATAVLAALALTACGGDASENGSVKIDPVMTETVMTEPVEVLPVLTMAEFSGELRTNGGVLRFTECPSDDASRWDGANDPFGVLVCNADYDVLYSTENGQWSVTGVKEREGVSADKLLRQEASYPGADPSEGMMVVWGGRYRFDEAGVVYARRGEAAVGVLTLKSQ